MIARFRFRLERVLRYRQSLRDLKQQELAAVEAALAREREALAEMLAMRDEVLEELVRLQAGSFAALEREPYTRHLAWLEDETDRQRARIAEAEKARDEKRSALVKAAQEHRIVERLRERRREEHGVAEGRDAQAALDEVAGGVFARRRLEAAS